MDFTLVDPIARAILYEGYLLYPYRTSSLKNRQPCGFGSLYPKAYSLLHGESEPWSMHTECLVRGEDGTTLQGIVRFLHPGTVDGRMVTEREVILPACTLHELSQQSARIAFAFPEDKSPSLKGCVTLSVAVATNSVFKVHVQIANETALEEADQATMLSTHAVLGVVGGHFLSLIDPPANVRALAETCQNRGAWPVLVGDRERQNMILAAPIILYDFPQIAPESPGNLFDGTEIDELLTLRILTLTESEKQALRSDEGTRALLERTENLAGEQLLTLHGTRRDIPFASEATPLFRSGARVCLRPLGRADVLDLALEGKPATIASIEQDFEGRIFYTVILDDDPGQDLGREGRPGHRFFFRREELELLCGEA